MRVWKVDTIITLDQCRKFLKYYGEGTILTQKRPVH